MPDFDWKKTLATVAPTVAAALGGPLGGMAAKIACDALGLPEASEGALQEAVMGGNPDVLVQLRQAEADLKIREKELGVRILELDVQDRDSARELGIKKGIWVQAALTLVFGALFSWLLSLIFTGEEVVHQSMRDIAILLIGNLTAILIQQMNFWFGSSEGSKRKTPEGLAGAVK